jgi:Na+/H+ antiporter NhaD/arsenite permease-like protein
VGSLTLAGQPIEYFIFGATLVVIASFHAAALPAALGGLAALVLYKFTVLGETAGARFLVHHFDGEWPGLANLFLLLMGFAILADHFERSGIPDAIPPRLPRSWIGGVLLLAIVFVMSSFLDNIAGAIIGGIVAKHAFDGRIGTGYLAAIVAAANAGGAGSILGDTTTTMLWINGIPALTVSTAFIAALAAFLVFAPLAALQQHRISSIRPSTKTHPSIDWSRAVIVLIFLMTVVAINMAGNALAPHALQATP